jgi:protein AroM
MKKIGLLTIGQSPRDDIISNLLDILGNEIEIVQAGALDDLNYSDIMKIPLLKEDYILVSRMRDGKEIKVTKKAILPRMQKKLNEIENQRVELTVVMCMGEFPHFNSKGIVVTPQEILKGVLKGFLKKGKLGVVYPVAEQELMVEKEFGRKGIELYADSISPYMPKNIEEFINRLKKENPDLIFLNCFGFTRELQSKIKLKTGKPTILSNSIIARVIKEFIL